MSTPSRRANQPEGDLLLAIPLLPLDRPARARLRSVRRPFSPTGTNAGPYRLPHDVRDRLVGALAPYRNRDAALGLAVFLGRYWSAPGRLTMAFAIDRRELAEHAVLDLTEARVRGAIRVLEDVGFLDRAVAGGRTHKLADSGALHRKPIKYQFTSDYAGLFVAANTRARAARERRSRRQASELPARPQRPLAGACGARFVSSPKNKDSEATKVYLGEISSRPPAAFVPETALDRALDRWRLVFEENRAGQGS